MCGISGIYGFDDKELVKRMNSAIAHRGPDDEGFYFDSKIGLGHRRLSIIDLSTGKQPMTNEDDSAVIVFNGEIFNFRELATDLKRKGHRFKTSSDTEAIIHLYEEYGENCVSYLNGFFAFAIWDGKKLFLARDRAGIKPLYYHKDGEKLLFASEIKAILQYQEFKRDPNPNAINRYLTLRYNTGNDTFLKGVMKLPPGHTMTVHNGDIKIKRYWAFETIEEKKGEEYYIKKLRSLFTDSVKRRMISDVPFGAYLSGGIDSSAIVALMAKATDDPIKTFSLGFQDRKIDETKNAIAISDMFSTDHHEIFIEDKDIRLLPKIIWHLDDPVGDTAIIANHVLANFAHKHVKVVLSGEGADELFGGYMQHKNMMRINRVRSLIPRASSRIVKHVPVGLLDKVFHYPVSMGKIGRERLAGLIQDIRNPTKNYLNLISTFSAKDKETYAPEFMNSIEDMETRIGSYLNKEGNILNRVIKYEFESWLPDNILHKLDKITMANSLEGRVPFLDYRIVELSGKMPCNIKIKGGMEKYVLRKAMQGILPKAVIKRKKHAFYVPVDELFYKEVAPDLVQGIKNRGYFNKDIKKMLSKPKELLHEKQYTQIALLELWHRVFIDGEKT